MCSPTECGCGEDVSSCQTVEQHQTNLAISQPDGFAGVEVSEAAPTLLSDADIHQAYLDAYAIWRPAMVRLLRGGLIFYNGIYPLDSALLGVFEYLCKQRDATSPKKEDK